MSKPTPVAWRWSGPKGGFIYDEKKPSWFSDALYPSSAIQALEEENKRLREEFLSAKEAHLSITRETNARATAAEARLKEALKVIEPFVKFTPEQCFKEDTCWELVECKATGGGWFGSEDFRAARRFITALQEKENTNDH